MERRGGQLQPGAALAIRAEYALRTLEAGQEAGHDVALLADGARARRAERGDPDRWVRLLVRARPDVHLAVMEVLAFPVERTGVARPRLHDEVVSFPEAGPHPGRPMGPPPHLVLHPPP